MENVISLEFSQQLRQELEWLKINHPDKLALTHIAERFFEFLADEGKKETKKKK